ncbi:MAG: hypothetical protein HZB25_04500 [Candidatus Eisenbacteria bacterium]|nr:hypothetical protein [Candidatus Eisenbacteria bacterium]
MREEDDDRELDDLDDDAPIPGDVFDEDAELPGGGELPGGDEGGDEGAGPRLILVDGEAVIRGSASLNEAWATDRASAVLTLVNLLSWAMAHQGADFILVVDESCRADDVDVAAAGLAQRCPAPGQTVSEMMMFLAESSRAEGRPTTVVTSDVEVVRFAALEGIQSNLADLFAASLVGGATKEDDEFQKPPGLTPKESREWDEFVAKWKRGRA